ncbi:hypothetical protein GWI33_001776 [Rhynchophorus ferrugineus]|uniref:Uncharacterized protein n=1 Tax=Rhynchophorus ferrugineus TaxID=354439 RepID=A0A834IN76_RHYFE|nr:hypothetical protein GWI33_001776 [Rhynchophorus ferrugineus]
MSCRFWRRKGGPRGKRARASVESSRALTGHDGSRTGVALKPFCFPSDSGTRSAPAQLQMDLTPNSPETSNKKSKFRGLDWCLC